MTSDPTVDGIRTLYRNFATYEAHGISPRYEQFALAVADDPATLAFLEELPAPKRQPNVLLAAVRHVAGLSDDAQGFLRSVASRRDTVREVMLARSTQANEPVRRPVTRRQVPARP